MLNYFFYNSDMEYPEDIFSNIDNKIENSISKLFEACKFDNENIGSSEWNPLKEIIKEGNTVLIKPNLVNHFNPAEKDEKKGMDCMITHPSLVKCIFDYVLKALDGKGKIIVADAPVQGCDFNELLVRTQYGQLFEYMNEKNSSQLQVITADLRDSQLFKENGQLYQKKKDRIVFAGKVIDLHSDSYMEKTKKRRLRVTDYAAKDTVKHHINGKNEYLISEALLEADVVINMPKPKTHRIAGYTGALKNMIGINTSKTYLPHHQLGNVQFGGDEFTNEHIFLNYMNTYCNDIRNWAMSKNYRKVIDIFNKMARYFGIKLDSYDNNRKKHGAWYGNDTIWRTILDVNHIVNYCDKNGIMQDTIQRRIMNIGDMIVSGECEGPLNPSYKKVGGILFSDNAVEFDLCLVKLMGLKYNFFPVLANSLYDKKLSRITYENVFLCSNAKEFNGRITDINQNFGFELSNNWKDYDIR